MERVSDDLEDDLLISIMMHIDRLSSINTDVSVDTGEVTLEQRLQYLSRLAGAVKDLEIDVMTNEKAVTEQLTYQLEKDVKTLDKLKLEKESALQEDEKLLESLQKQLAQLREGRALRQVEGEMKAMDDVQLVLRKAKIKFREARDDLDDVLDMVLGGDEESKEVILAVTKAYFSGDDVYVDVKDHNWISRLELLHRGKIIAYHPYNKRKIRLAAVD